MAMTFNKVMSCTYYIIAVCILFLGVMTEDEVLSTLRLLLGLCLFIAGMIIGKEK